MCTTPRSRWRRPDIDARPIVVTLALDDATQQRLDDERHALFPPGRTAVGAHVTLFHAVPAELAEDVDVALAESSRREPFGVRFDSVMSLGRGAAYHFKSSALSSLHRSLQRRWEGVLTRQDEQPLRAHVTVQNKVGGDEARATLGRLRATFAPFDATATGLRSWRYDGGPWEPIASFPFDRAPEGHSATFAS